jgi:hypothetical protein
MGEISEYGKYKLTIELIPSTCWYSNVRAYVELEDWNWIRRTVCMRADHCCEICGSIRQPLECHEVWEYDFEGLWQVLEGFTALCKACHQVKHIGRTISVGLGEVAIIHLARINEWSVGEAEEYADKMIKLNRKDSQFDWDLDLRLLAHYNIDYIEVREGVFLKSTETLIAAADRKQIKNNAR